MTKAEKLEMVKEYRQAAQKMAELKEKYEKIGQDVFAYEVKELFDQNPTLIDFGWRQYTPVFNDGDPCTFRCYKDCPFVNGVGEYDEDFDEDATYPTLADGELEELSEKVGELLDNYTKDDMLSLFGNCVSVRVNRKGLEITEYSPY